MTLILDIDPNVALQQLRDALEGHSELAVTDDLCEVLYESIQDYFKRLRSNEAAKWREG